MTEQDYIRIIGELRLAALEVIQVYDNDDDIATVGGEPIEEAVEKLRWAVLFAEEFKEREKK